MYPVVGEMSQKCKVLGRIHCRICLLVLVVGLALAAGCESGNVELANNGEENSSLTLPNSNSSAQENLSPIPLAELQTRLFAAKTAQDIEHTLATITAQYPHDVTGVVDRYLTGELNGKLDPNIYWTICEQVAVSLANVAVAGDRQSLQYLQNGIDPNFWRTKKLAWGRRGSPPEAVPYALANNFTEQYRKFAFESGDEEKGEAALAYFEILYKKSIEEKKIPRGIIADSIAIGLLRKRTNFAEAKPEIEDIVEVYLSDEYPAQLRCFTMLFKPGDAGKVYLYLKNILSDDGRKSDWPMAIRGMAHLALAGMRDEAFEYLLDFLEQHFGGNLDFKTFAALAEVPTAMAILSYPNYKKGKDYMEDGVVPSNWERKQLKWRYDSLHGETRDLYLAQLFVKNYGLLLPADEHRLPALIERKISQSGNAHQALTQALDAANKKMARGRGKMCIEMALDRKNAFDIWNYPY
ncbi:MAG: hypothetical protein H6683_01930 [Deltaproteobacteria bacterium]|nr:hypothetical protein [Deltaproteobacteria bacterium]MCB9478417.1 hypothetical protein [Deltaproteobacteria bacterium]